MNISGHKYAQLTVVRKVSGGKHAMWLCICTCGVHKQIDEYSLRSGRTRSCGCYNREVSARRRTHGHACGGRITPTYNAWAGMIQRCTHKGYSAYYDRGISVCSRWRKFACFLADMGERPSARHSLDRIDNDGNYCKTNCRWATKIEQMRNMRTSVHVEWRGERLTIAAWAERLRLRQDTLRARLRAGWNVACALTAPRLTHKGVAHACANCSSKS